MQRLCDRHQPKRHSKRRGGFIVLGLFSLIVGLSFVGFTVDLGMINVTKTRMQATADACALAATQEIQIAVIEAGKQGGDGWDAAAANQGASQQAGQLAAVIANENNLFVDPSRDVRFGKRVFIGNGQYHIVWGSAPYNAVEVTVQKMNDDPSAPDAKLDLFFSPLYGDQSTAIKTKAAAFIESRDIVAVLDYSGSMTFDSQLRSATKSTYGVAGVASNLNAIWDALRDSGVEFSNAAGVKKFPANGFAEINSYAGKYVTGSSSSDVYGKLGLGGTSGGDAYYTAWPYKSGSYWYTWYNGIRYAANQYYVWKRSGYRWRRISQFPGNTDDVGGSSSPPIPWPQEGKYSNGNLRGKMSDSSSEQKWKDYINWVRSDSDVGSFGMQHKYGYQTLMAYIIEHDKGNKESEDLWRAPIYPVHAMKEGMTQLTSFLSGLQFGDTLGLVTYATTSRVETGLWEDGADANVDLGGYHLTTNYGDINTIQRHKQGGHYDQSTNMGSGTKDGRQLLINQGRDGARPTMIIMTDGQTNKKPDGWSLPAGFSWSEYTDFDHDGSADYSTSDSKKQYAFYEASLAIDQGFTIHTMSVGAGADKTLMEAIANAGGGTWVDVDPGASPETMQTALQQAFATLAGDVPPAKLTSTD